MTIRTVLVIPTMDRGGAEKQLSLLARHLPRDRFDPHVCLLTRDGPLSGALRRAEVPVTVIGKRFRADPTAYWKLRRYFRELSPQIVHTWLFAANSFGRAAALASRVPVVLASERCVDPWKRNWQFRIDRFLARRSAGITTNSTAVRDFYVRHGIDRSLFHVIPNGVPARVCDPIAREQAFRRLGVSEDRKLVLAVGRLWPQKRYRDLVWAGELLAATRDDTTLVIIGDGPQKEELLRFRDAVTIPKHVAFVGPRDDVPQLLPHADLFWIGSEYEGQSNALIEAMQAGVPVVASDIPGNRDLVTNGKTGRLVRLGDRAGFAAESLELLEQPAVASELAEQAKERIRNDFSVDAMVRAHARLYAQFHEGFVEASGR